VQSVAVTALAIALANLVMVPHLVDAAGASSSSGVSQWRIMSRPTTPTSDPNGSFPVTFAPPSTTTTELAVAVPSPAANSAPTTSTAPTFITPSGLAALGLVPVGQGTAFGCKPALVYLALYAAPGYRFVCPGDAQGHQATTCDGSYPCVPGQRLIIIADPCPAAYMNEASNSWAVLDGGEIDPYGACPG
jgi:hypothetical protein